MDTCIMWATQYVHCCTEHPAWSFLLNSSYSSYKSGATLLVLYFNMLMGAHYLNLNINFNYSTVFQFA